MNTYRVRARRRSGERWWAIDFPDVPYTYSQVKRLDQLEAAARDALALQLDVAPDSFALDVDVDLPPELRANVNAATTARRDAEAAAAKAAMTTRAAVDALSGQLGLSVRDIGDLVGITPQRVSQIQTEAPGRVVEISKVIRREPTGPVHAPGRIAARTLAATSHQVRPAAAKGAYVSRSKEGRITHGEKPKR